MDDLELEIKRQVMFCLLFKNYKCGIFVSDLSKVKKINDILLKELGHMDLSLFKKYIKSESNPMVVFFNSASIKVFVFSESCMRNWSKVNGGIIDKAISQDIKNCVLCPMIVPRLIEVDDGVLEFEDRLETNKRIVEVEV